MRGTASIRTVMRWLSYSRIVAISLMSACVLGTTRFYTPRAAGARFDLAEMRSRASVMLPIACPRVVHERNAVFAATDISLDVDSTGAVQRAEIAHGSGDASLDDLFGALAAQLQLQPSPPRPAPTGTLPADPPPSPAPLERRHLAVSYACASDAGTVAVQLQPG
jgi:hypothetical protein